MSTSPKPLNIALLGTRGVPARYGGFETCVEEVGKRLVRKGHRVTVYCRSSYYEQKLKKYLGMSLVYHPSLKKKSLDTLSHVLFSVLHATRQNYDVCMVFNAANSPFLFPLKILRKKIAINPDGLEWKRTKWNVAGKTYARLAERISCKIADRIVSDSRAIQEYYLSRYGIETSYIAYGAYIFDCQSTRRIEQMGLRKGEYFLQITRFEPENHPLLTAKAFSKLRTDKKLVIVGGSPYSTSYVRKLMRYRSTKVLFPGFIYDHEVLRELWCNCFAYVHGNSVGGTNPTLLQAMGAGCFVIAYDVLFNREVLRDCGIYYDENVETLTAQMNWALNNEKSLRTFGEKARTLISQNFTWDLIANKYEKMFFDLLG